MTAKSGKYEIISMRLRLSIILSTFLVLLGVNPGRIAKAQDIDIGVVSEDARGATYELKALWPASLKAIADSTHLVSFNRQASIALSRGLVETSETLKLPALITPRLRIVSVDFDEIPLPLDAAFAEDASQFEGPAAFIADLGTYRKEPVASLGFRLLGYDRDAGVARRYRRILVEVTYVSGADRIAGKREEIVANPHLLVERSVLADGTVLKIPITREGIYRIDRSYLTEAGLNPDAIEPDRLQVFGNGGAPLPAVNGVDRPADLIQNPVFVRGGGDGSFDDGDVLIFYASAPEGWRYDAEAEGWTHFVNPFDTENYYFLKLADEDGVRVNTEPFPAFTDATVFASVTGRLFVDFDQFVWSKQNGSGLTWISTPIDATGRQDVLTDSLPPGFEGGEVNYQVRVAIKSNPAAFARFQGNSGQLSQVRTGTVRIGEEEDPSARLTVANFVESITGGQSLNLSVTLEAQPNSPEVAVDWARAFYPQSLTASNGVLRFATPAGQTGRMEFVLDGFIGTPQVWDVTDPGSIRQLATQPSGNAFRVQVEVSDVTQPREIMAFLEPAAASLDAGLAETLTPQNLHGLQEYPDFVIVSPPIFHAYAEQLADKRRGEGLNVVVADIGQIYNEFSGGLVDMRAPRDYFRFLYDRAPSDAQRLKYVLFYGDGHFNYRNLGAESPELENWLPPYETEDSFTPDRTYTSDDYFGLLDEEEGEWVYRGHSFPRVTGELTDPVDRVDIGIGRLPVQTEEEAASMIEKIEHYENPETYGQWRSQYTFIADDHLTGLSGTREEDDLHLQNADVVAELVRANYAQINVSKIYASSFDRVFRNGFRVPGAREEIIKSIEEGSLVVNYSGHGGEEGLAQEGIFTAEDAKELDNFDRLSVFVTATCSFGWWDLTNYQSGAEELLLNPNGGAVALLTTVRLVYTSPDINSLNVGLNRQLTNEMFEPEADGMPRRLGDVLRITKNSRAGLQGNNRKFNLLGDPTMRIGIPGRRVEIESLNDVALAEQTGQMRALDRVSIRGSVVNGAGQVDEQFTGVVDITVFDAERRIPIEHRQHMPTPYYTVREDLIWRGQVQAEQGRFNATFVVPKDISYSNQTGRLSVYAYSAGTQALGYNENFAVGGTSPNPPDDATGPQITLFLNDTTFVSGGLTTPDPQLIVKLFDDSGINTVGAGVGHEMLLILNDDAQNAIDISSGFRSEANSYQRGTVQWDIPEQQLGANTLSLRVWDVLNNSSVSTLDFFVAPDEDLVLRNVFNYPNPTSGETRFVFEHNQPVGTNASIQVRVYTLAGRLIRTLETDEVLAGGVIQLPWNGRDEDEDPLATGIYLYKLRVEVESQEGDRQVSEHIEKLAVIR